MLSKSMVTWWFFSAMRTAFWITVRVLRPRKSIFNSPSSSMVVMVNWVVMVPSAALERGTNSSMERLPITTPAACMEVCRGSPSSRFDMSMRLCTVSSSLYAFFRSGFMVRALSSVMPRSLGIIFAMVSHRA